MAIRIGWDKFEVALLIDACNQVLNKKIAKPEIVSRLSAALRSRAVEQGVEIDEIFRNESGISLQMTKMDYLLADGKIGLPGASKLYAEIAELSKSNPADFAKLLVEAKEQIGVKEARVRFAMRDVYQLYAKHHAEFTADDIYNLSKELDATIYFDALAEVSVRVSNDLFVSKKQISFDVDAIDKVIGSFMAKDYIRIREIDSFLVFPNVGYEWNEYLLESFVASYSRKFALLSNGHSLNNVAGAIVKKDGKINEFVDVCAAALADSGISLKKTEALNYLADVNLITRRSYRDLDSAIRKATQIRGRKE